MPTGHHIVSVKRFIQKVAHKVLGAPYYPQVYSSFEEADRHLLGAHERQVIILEDRVVKRQSPRFARIELEKTARATFIGSRCGWFQVPRILDADEERGIICFERLRGVVPLWYALRRGYRTDDILERLARSLATVHNELQLPPEMSIESAPPWGESARCPTVYIHGDFKSENILVSSDNHRLWIIDWWTDSTRTVGPCYHDIAMLLGTILQNRYMGLDFIRSVDYKIGVFLRTYFQDCKHPCDIQALQKYLSSVFVPNFRLILNPPPRSLSRLLLYHWTLGTSPARLCRFVRRFDGKLPADQTFLSPT